MPSTKRSETERKSGGSIAELVAAAERLGTAKGLAGITTRTLARATNRSISSVGYHFGGQEGVLVALYHKLAQDMSDWRKERLQALQSAQAVFLEPSSAATQLLTDLIVRCRPRTLLMQEIEDLALRGGLNLTPAIAAESSAMRQFWLDVLERCGIKPSAAKVFADIVRGTIPTLLVEPDPVICATYIGCFMQRLEERLAGREPVYAHEPVPARTPVTGAEDAPRGKRLIIDAALRLIGEKGVPQVTHREIASAAGLSVAATTYFFKSKDEIIIAAFHELLRRISAAHTAPAPDSGAFTGSLLTKTGEIGWEANAIRSWYLAAARDPELLPSLRIVQSNYWGIAAATLLSVYDVTNVDRIDGMLGTFLANSAINDCRLLKRQQRAAFMAKQVESGVSLLFAGQR